MPRKIINIDEELCDGCGQCITACEENALEIVNGKAVVVADRFCDGLGACMGECPTGALSIVEREAESFDEHAVHDRNRMLAQKSAEHPPRPAGGCPSAGPQAMRPCPGSRARVDKQDRSVLPHWPIKLRLVPEDARFFQRTGLLLAADCAAPAQDGLGADLEQGYSLAMACPKFEDYFSLTGKLSRIIAANDIQEIKVLEIEVPCCSGLHKMALQAGKMAGKQVRVVRSVIGRDGKRMQETIVNEQQGQKEMDVRGFPVQSGQ